MLGHSPALQDSPGWQRAVPRLVIYMVVVPEVGGGILGTERTDSPSINSVCKGPEETHGCGPSH